MDTNATEATHALESLRLFNWVEYTIFFSLISTSALIGIYYGFRPKKHGETVEDYMLGGKKMPILPVALSLVSSFVSGISLLGIPSETYVYGSQIFGINFAIVASAILHSLFYLPLLYELQFNSLYEYLERRFDRSVRQIASFVFTLSLITYLPIVIYIPSLAFNQVTGMSIYKLAPIICAICIFYTTFGGLKAVVWSDALQSIFTMGSVTVVLILGIISVGGISKLIEINEEGERLELFNMDLDPFTRNTFWTTAFGSTPHWLKIFATHPSSVQRYISLPTYRDCQIVAVIMCLGIFLIKSFCTVTGLVIYAKYHDCDPIITKQIQKPGQILPFYIMEVAKDYPGLAGVFLSGVVSTALSTMSTGLNTAAGTTYEDFIKPLLPWKPSDRTANLIMKTIVVVLGVLITSLVFIVEKLGTIMQVSLSLHGVTTGVQLYLFTLGMFLPWANAKGALSGAIAGIASTLWLLIGAQSYQQAGHIRFGQKVTSIEGCPANMTIPPGINGTTFGHPGVGTIVEFDDEVPLIYRISYLYYSMVGFTVAITVAMTVSLLTGLQDPSELDPKLIVRQLRRFLGTKKRRPSVELYNVVPTKDNGMG